MPSQSKYFYKGIIRAILLIAAIGTIYYGISLKNQPQQKKPDITSYDEIMQTPQIENGKLLFNKSCVSCHKINATDEVLLQKIVDSNYNKKDLYAWIRNGDSVLKSGNVYYNNLVKQFNNVRMFSFSELTDKDLDDIFLYIKAEKIYQSIPKDKRK